MLAVLCGFAFTYDVIFQYHYATLCSQATMAPTKMTLFFLSWLHDMDMPNDINCLLLGDLNLIRSLEDSNKLGENIQPYQEH
jgi:hypothetical protein